MESIYSNADSALLKLFEQAANPRHFLCVPIDFAKATHAILFCNGLGDIYKKPFNVANSKEGADKLIREVQATCKHRSIKPKHVVFGGEDLPSYAENFLAELRRHGFLTARVNAFDAKKQREKLQASTDFLDLSGIAHCLLKARARVLVSGTEIHRNLRTLVRERDYMVRALTGLRCRLHPHVDQLFPGFLSQAQSGIYPYGEACCWLLQSRFSAPQIARRNTQKLAEGLAKHRVKKAAEVAEQLQTLAAGALPPADEIIPFSQFSIERLLEIENVLKAAINQTDKTIAQLLVQSPGARLTTIPGLGVTLSAGLISELFLLGPIPSLSRLCSYAGIIPATEQTGGPAKAPHSKTTFPHCNRRLKYYLLQAAERMAQIKGTDAWAVRQKAVQQGQHTLRVLGKHCASVIRSILLNERAYLPQALYDPNSKLEDRGIYYQHYWPKLVQKWAGRAPAQRVFEPASPLGLWRAMAQDAYGISLPLSGDHIQPTEKPNTADIAADPDTLEELSQLI